MKKSWKLLVSILAVILIVAAFSFLGGVQVGRSEFAGVGDSIPKGNEINFPFSYLIDTNSTHYFLGNGTTWKWDAISTNASYILQQSFGNDRLVHVKSGIYTINNEVKSTYKGLTLEGEGANSTIFKLGANGRINFTRSVSAPIRYFNRISGIGFNGQDVAANGIVSKGTSTLTAGNVELFDFIVDKCMFWGFDGSATQHAISLVGLQGGGIYDSDFSDGYNIIYLWEDGTYEAGNFHIERNRIITSKATGVGVYINNTGSDSDSGMGGIWVEDNQFLGDDNGAYAVMLDARQAQETAGHVWVVDNIAETINLFKALSTVQYVKYIEIYGNTVNTGSGTAIALTSYSQNLQIHDNSLYCRDSAIWFADNNTSSTAPDFFYNNNLLHSGTGSGSVSIAANSFIYIANNFGLNPLGNSTNFRISTASMGFYGANSNWVNGTVYTVRTTDLILSVSGGTGLNVTIYDNGGDIIATGLGAGVYTIPWGYKFSVVSSAAPTLKFGWK